MDMQTGTRFTCCYLRSERYFDAVALLEAEMVDYVRGKFRLSADKPSTLETSLYSSVDIISPYSLSLIHI